MIAPAARSSDAESDRRRTASAAAQEMDDAADDDYLEQKRSTSISSRTEQEGASSSSSSRAPHRVSSSIITSTDTIGRQHAGAAGYNHRRAQSTATVTSLFLAEPEQPQQLPSYRVRSLSLAAAERPSLDRYYPGSHLVAGDHRHHRRGADPLLTNTGRDATYLSLWLLPPRHRKPRLAREIAQLALRFRGSAPFAPHVTVIGSIPCQRYPRQARELGEQLRRELQHTGAVPCRFSTATVAAVEPSKNAGATTTTGGDDNHHQQSSSNGQSHDHDTPQQQQQYCRALYGADGEIVWSQACVAVMERSGEFLELLARARKVLRLPPGEWMFPGPAGEPHFSKYYGHRDIFAANAALRIPAPEDFVADEVALVCTTPGTVEGVGQWHEITRISLLPENGGPPVETSSAAAAAATSTTERSHFPSGETAVNNKISDPSVAEAGDSSCDHENSIQRGSESGLDHAPPSTRLPEPPPSPTQRCSRTLKGESIRSLRELLRVSLSSSSSLFPVEEGKKDKQPQPQLPKNEPAGPQNDDAAKQHADAVRSRLLHNLGIQKPPPDPAMTAAAPNSAPQQQPWGPSYTVPLNDATSDADDHLNKNSNSDTGSSESNTAETTVVGNDNDDDNDNQKKNQSKVQQQRHLHFDPVVQVHPIPCHTVYSKRIQQTIWTGADELAENVARNSLEFSSENWDAEQVLDEDGGLLYHQGEWIHPVHFDFDLPPSPDNDQPVLSSDEIWKQTCERLGIQPAEYYHSIR